MWTLHFLSGTCCSPEIQWELHFDTIVKDLTIAQVFLLRSTLHTYAKNRSISIKQSRDYVAEGILLWEKKCTHCTVLYCLSAADLRLSLELKQLQDGRKQCVCVWCYIEITLSYDSHASCPCQDHTYITVPTCQMKYIRVYRSLIYFRVSCF